LIDVEPTAELDARFSSDDATPTMGGGARASEEAEIYWIYTVRSDRHPRVSLVRDLWTPAATAWEISSASPRS
jgi:hypothetical protein